MKTLLRRTARHIHQQLRLALALLLTALGALATPAGGQQPPFEGKWQIQVFWCEPAGIA